jgi:aminodeoxyfutalosine synthase
MSALVLDHAEPCLSPVAHRALERAGLAEIRDKVVAGERLTYDDGLALYASNDLAPVGALANLVRERKHGDITYFNRNIHVDPTNVCVAECIFCSFSRLKTGDPNAYLMEIEEVVGRVKDLRGKFLTEIHMVNGLNPDLPFSYYTDLLRALKVEQPDLHIKAFTAVEIHFFAEFYGMSYEQVLRALMEAGLDSMPGGGAEIFHPRARKKLCRDKADADEWLAVHRLAHQLGMRTNCTMLFGSIERIEERVDHVIRLRELQDETGGFQTFIPLRFHNTNNRLRKIPEPTAGDTLRTFAVSRLMLDNMPHVKAYWPMLGIELAQLSLDFGVDDIDGTVLEERIYHMAGAATPQGLARADLVALIRRAGRIPVERDTLYHVAAEA